MKAVWNGKTIAESNAILDLEGDFYFPFSSLKRQYFRPSQTRSTCLFKGRARYLTLKVNGQFLKDAAWYYSPSDECADLLKNRVGFWKGVEFQESSNFRKAWEVVKVSLNSLKKAPIQLLSKLSS